VRSVVVVGAGFAGLAAADALQTGNVKVSVVEARDRVGGRVWSVPFGESAVVERGAEFILPGNSAVAGMAARFGLGLVRKGTPYGRREPRGGEAVPWAELEAAFDRIGEGIPPGADTVAEAIDALRLPPSLAAVIRARIEVSMGHPADDLQASVLGEGAATFGDFHSYTIERGNSQIARALAAGLEEPVLLSSPARSVRWNEAGVTLGFDGGELDADAAVIAAPASVLDRIDFQPALEGPTADALSGVRYGQNAKLFLPLRGPSPPSAVMSVRERFWTYTQLDGHGEPAPFLVGYAGTMPAIEALRVADGPETWARAVRALRPELDLAPDEPLLSTWHDDPWVRGSYSARSLSSPLRDDELARPIGPLFFAGEHTAGEWHGLMEGALRSGVRAARQLLAAQTPVV
jgi:monoamine oxidase